MAKKFQHQQFLACFFAVLGPLQAIKHHQTIFFLVEEVLSFDLVSHM